ncbi:MAG: DUF4331 domain-containing protein [Labilithrix sp.]|nr:DUF4331 domain-containing protein [Labilithrix sp.]
MKLRHIATGALSAIAFTGVVATAGASSHREAPAIGFDPAADNTDVWAWVNDGAHDKLTIVAAYNPLEEPSGGPNYHEFSDDVLYEVHITRGNKSLEDVVTYQIQFSSTDYPRVDPANLSAPVGGGKEFFSQLSGRKQTYWLTKVERDAKGKTTRTVLGQGLAVAPVNIGPNTNKIVYGTEKYDDAFAGKFVHGLGFNGGEGRVFAGPRDDGFYVDIGRIFDLANLLGGTPRDNVAGYNCHAIALEIPTASLTADKQAPKAGASDANTIGVWASASRRQVRVLHQGPGESNFGSWVQVSRLGLPLVNEALIGLQDKDKYNRTRPAKDVANFGAYFLNPVVVRDAEAVGIYKALGVPDDVVTSLKSNRLDIIDTINLKASGHDIPLSATGDVLRVDLGLDSRFPNGRPIPYGAAPNKEQADVTDVLLSVILSKGTVAISDGAQSNDKPYLAGFPYLALPHEGFSGGHGTATDK